MRDKPIAYIAASVLMVGCCLGMPLLLMFLSGAAFTAWAPSDGVAGLALAVFVVAVAVFMLHRRSRRRAGPRRRAATNAMNVVDAVDAVDATRKSDI